MNPERYALSREYFHQMLTMTPQDRAKRLAALPADEQDIRTALEQLLAEAELNPGFLEGEVAAVAEFRPLLAVGENLGGRHEVLEFIGAGGMGEVYRARDCRDGSIVALKILKGEGAGQPAMVSRLKKELRLAQRIQHKNVCRMLGLERAERNGIGLDYITMEFLGGPTLARRLKQGPLEMNRAEAIAEELIAGLAAAHQQGIIHRDLKSANVMFDEDRVVITDFGLAREQDGKETYSAFGTGALIGTPAYMAPEQLRGEKLTLAADLHALGVVLFEIATGRLPFEGETALAIALKRTQGRAPSPREFVPGLETRWEQTILACLEAEAHLRPASAEAVLDQLKGRVKRKRPLPSRRQIASGVALAVAASGVVWVGLNRKGVAPEALRSWKKAEEFARRRTGGDLKNAVTEYEQALRIEPEYAAAWSGLANAYSALGEFGLMETKAAGQKALAAAEKAIGLDASSARAYGVKGYILSNRISGWTQAGPLLERAVALDPKEPMARLWYASFLGKNGKAEEALRQLREGLDDEPSHFVLNQQLAAELYRARQYEACLKQSQELERLQPYEGGTHFMLARALERMGQYSQAMERCERAVQYGLGERLVDCMRSVIECSRKNREGAERLAAGAERYWREKPLAAIHVATAYGHLGNSGKAIEILLEGCEREDASVLGAPRHPLLEGLKRDGGYTRFARRIGLG